MPKAHSLARRRSAFTLTELLVVVAVIAVLTGLTFTLFASAARSVEGLQARVTAAHSSEKLKEIKILPEKAGVGGTGPGRPKYIEDQYLLILKGDPGVEAARLAAASGGKVLFVYRSALWGCALQVPPAGLAVVKADPAVLLIERDVEVFPAVQTVPAGIRRTQIRKSGGTTKTPFLGGKRQIGNIGTGGGSATVAVIDSGVDANHPDLNVVFNKGFGQPDIGDENGHGTHVAGTIAALDNDEGVVGMVPGARIVNLRVFPKSGGTSTATIVAAVDYVTQNAANIQVCNMSLGGGKTTAMNAAVDACVAAGVTVVVAAGNSNDDAAKYSPASADSVICVAALADSDGLPGGLGGKTSAGNDDTFATFSNYGSVVDVIAPGVDVLSTLPGGTYGLKSGTSMACPHTAGLAARILGGGVTRGNRGIGNLKNPIGGFLPPSFGTKLTPAEVKALIEGTSTEPIAGIYDKLNYRLINGSAWAR